MTTADDLALQSVIHYHLNEAIRLMKATGEGADPIVWDALKVYMPRGYLALAGRNRQTPFP